MGWSQGVLVDWLARRAAPASLGVLWLGRRAVPLGVGSTRVSAAGCTPGSGWPECPCKG